MQAFTVSMYTGVVDRRDREERRREKRRSLQRQEGGGQEGALDDYFDSRWDERRPD